MILLLFASHTRLSIHRTARAFSTDSRRPSPDADARSIASTLVIIAQSIAIGRRAHDARRHTSAPRAPHDEFHDNDDRARRRDASARERAQPPRDDATRGDERRGRGAGRCGARTARAGE